jgi:hypothetical protein
MWRTGWSRFDGVASPMPIELALTVLGRRVGRRTSGVNRGQAGLRGYAGEVFVDEAHDHCSLADGGGAAFGRA